MPLGTVPLEKLMNPYVQNKCRGLWRLGGKGNSLSYVVDAHQMQTPYWLNPELNFH